MGLYVFDLDGTLADCSHRLHHLERKDWRAFFAACAKDKLIEHVRTVLWGLAAGGHRIEIWSGRSDECRSETVAWLEDNDIGFDALLMRKAGDHRPDDNVKREFLQGARPDLIFEDRSRVVDMWRAEGIPCFQVAAGDF